MLYTVTAVPVSTTRPAAASHLPSNTIPPELLSTGVDRLAAADPLSIQRDDACGRLKVSRAGQIVG
ncbi:hypothetical protein GCM10029963_13150 [Micromonospora andamanensis]|nr:hypothetical protein Vwe01_36170 [Micromonospora andamanensis]